MVVQGAFDFGEGEGETLGLDDETLDIVFKEDAFVFGGGAGGFLDDGTDAGQGLEEAAGHQVGNDLVGGVGVDAEFLAELADGGEAGTGGELALEDRLLHGVDDLFVDREAGLELNLEG